MFTGIIEELGIVDRVEPRAAGLRLAVRCRKVLEDAEIGSSISVGGVCLTAASVAPDSFSADVSPETARRSNLGGLRPGALVNLERPLSPSSRMGGHIVQGHVDGTGELVSLDALGDGNWWLSVQFPPDLDSYLVEKGSVAIDGISLTIAALEGDVLSATIVPHTYQNTALRVARSGHVVNLECDIIAKYVAKLLGRERESRPSGITTERLLDLGY
ncbi:MAG: riboflavin synthase [Bryobacteraceae bacterium]|nr:riboflavin synthase [Bryobacteraceae bacterium]